MKKKDVTKELERMGYTGVKQYDRPLQPRIPLGMKPVGKQGKLVLTDEKQKELRERDAAERASPEPVGTVVREHQTARTIELMILEDKPKTYSVEEVIDAVTTYALDGTMTAVTRAHGISSSVFGGWKDKPWFKELMNFVKNAKDHELEARMTSIVNATTNQLLDRIQNGDTGTHQGAVVYTEDETGELVVSKIPLTADQLSRIGAIYTDKRQILRGMSVADKFTNVQTIEQKLNQVAGKMLEIVENIPRGNTINITPQEEK